MSINPNQDIINYLSVRKYMYSRYVQSPSPAATAAQLQQCQQQDLLISQLKTEVHQLKQIEGDYRRLNDLVGDLERRYALLVEEKDRAEREQRVKADIDRTTVTELRAEIDAIQRHLHQAAGHIQELIRDNTARKRMVDARSQEVQALRFQLQDIENRNLRVHQDNKNFAATVRALKEDRKKLEEQCDLQGSLLDKGIAQLKATEKKLRANESSNARLDNILRQAEADNSKLLTDLKQKGQQVKHAASRLTILKNTIAEMNLSLNSFDKQVAKGRADLEKYRDVFVMQQAKGKELVSKLASVEESVRGRENELDQVIGEEERQRSEHFASVERNKGLNGQLDRMLALIAEYEQVNRELLDEVEIYIDQDEQARTVLDRKAAMKSLIQGTIRKVGLTGESIKHLKY